jgi:hypothetical protein
MSIINKPNTKMYAEPVSPVERMPEEYKPSRQKVLQEYEITLRFLSRGMVIHVGCQQIAFSDVKEGLDALNKYLESPFEEQQRWLKLLK